jgi:hypothetical protein
MSLLKRWMYFVGVPGAAAILTSFIFSGRNVFNWLITTAITLAVSALTIMVLSFFVGDFFGNGRRVISEGANQAWVIPTVFGFFFTLFSGFIFYNVNVVLAVFNFVLAIAFAITTQMIMNIRR